MERSRFVEPDLEEIADYIAQDNPERAASFIEDICERFRSIAERPLIYRLRPEIGAHARICVHQRYVILFRVLQESVRIERVVFWWAQSVRTD